MIGARIGGALLLATLFTAEAQGQTWRDLSTTRQLAGESRLDVRVAYGAGRIVLEPGDSQSLYRMRMRYDEDIFRPMNRLENGQLTLGLESTGRRVTLPRRESGGELDLRLGTAVPMALMMEFGAVRADLDVGGISLEDLHLKTGASDARLDVSRPNPIEMARARIEVGAASFAARNLGQLNARTIQVEAGVGDVRLDFGGLIQPDTRAAVRMGLGSMELRFPRATGVRIIRNTLLTSFDPEGMVRQGNEYVSPNWDTATHRLTVELDAAFGSVSVVWDG